MNLPVYLAYLQAYHEEHSVIIPTFLRTVSILTPAFHECKPDKGAGKKAAILNKTAIIYM